MIAVGDHIYGKAPEILVRVSCPFGGGLGGSREELCGVLSGGAIILGAMRGRLSSVEKDDPLRETVRAFREWFLRTYGSTACNPIRNQFPDVDKRCAPVVEAGTRKLVEIIEG